MKNTEFRCETCGGIHENMPAIGFVTPSFYDSLNESEKQDIAEISDDACIISYEDQTDRFIRTVLSIPIKNSCEGLDYGVWVSVSEKTLHAYKSNTESDNEVYFGMISNEIPGYNESTLHLHVNIEMQDPTVRPQIFLHHSDHQLVKDFTDGITWEEARHRIESIL